MTDPVPPPDTGRTCPACRRPVPPGHKFCESCGAKMPSLYTCSKCGTQFAHPRDFCDLCGAHVVPAGNAEPDKVVVRKKEETPEPEKVVIRKKDEAPEPATVVIHKKADTAEPETVVIRKKEAPSHGGDEMEGAYPGEPAEPGPEGAGEPAQEEITGPGMEEEGEPAREANGEEGPVEEESPGELPDEAAGENSPPGATDGAEDADLAAIFRPKTKQKSRQHDRTIREPETAELLEKYGKEYDEEEAQKSAGKPVTGWRSWFRRNEAPANADEALFLDGEKPVKKPSSKNKALQVLGLGMMLAALLGAIVIFGPPLLAAMAGAIGSPGEGETPLPEPTVTQTVTVTTVPTPASGSLVPRPTQTIPDHMPDFRVYKNLVTHQITVIFVGSSSGDRGITRADITVTHPDGSISSRTILPLKGIAEANLNGSEAPDRVQIDATVAGGETYHVYDRLLQPGEGI